MSHEILSVAEMAAADRYASGHGVPTLELMESAGRAVAHAIAARWTPRPTLVLCGPGNNGGDGYVAARVLNGLGWKVRTASLAPEENLRGDAAEMARRWHGPRTRIEGPTLDGAELVVDALFGAGLTRPLEGAAAHIVADLNTRDIPVVAVDVPSGIHGDKARPLGELAVEADLTVTFFCKKLAHVLMPAQIACGEVVVSDIGIPKLALEGVVSNQQENHPSLWRLPVPAEDGHKYQRGHCIVMSGPMHATGAARLAARAALRAGAGLVSVASPPDAVAVNAAQLTAVMVKPFAGAAALAGLLSDARLNAVVIGPGAGVGRETCELVAAVLNSGAGVVLDADALTSFAEEPQGLFALLREPAVLTPHEGEFERVFPGVLARSTNHVEAARAAAAAAHATVLLKGPDTVIASPDGRTIVNTHSTPWLATAGSGDVLSGIIGGLMAQGLNSFLAAAAAAWLHGDAARRFGPGLISEDLCEQLPAVISSLAAQRAPP